MAAEKAKKADRAEAEGESVQIVLDRLAQMRPTEQQAWLKRLEERVDRAARLTFKPDEADRHQADIHDRLHQKTITWETLRDVVQKTDSREKEAVKKLSKTYRRLVFQVFHKDLHAYGDRQRAWLELHQSWKDAGSPFESQERMIDWLETALGSITPSRIGPIPKSPTFEPVRRPAVAVKRKSAKPQAAVEKPAALAQARKSAKPQTALAEPVAQAHTQKPAKPQAAIARRPTKPPLPEPEPVATPLGRSIAYVPSLRPKDDAIAEPPAAAMRRFESKPPVAASLTDFHLPPRKAPSIGQSHSVVSPDVLREIASADAPPSPDSPIEPVAVKVDELSARIAGCNMALRTLEIDLDEKSDWNAARLEPLIERLEILVLRRYDLNLFREALSEPQRSAVDPLSSTKGVVAQMAARIVMARDRASSSKFDGTAADRQAELARLEELSRRLAELAGK